MSLRDGAQEIISAWNRDEVAIILQALSAVDEADLDYLLSRLGDGGRDRFWKAVVAEMRPVFALEITQPNTPADHEIAGGNSKP